MKKNYVGLTDEEVIKSSTLNGKNTLEKHEKTSFFKELIKILREPTLFLLIVAASIYFILGEYVDGIIMLFCVLSTCGIEFFQEFKTDKALEELNKLTAINVKVIRNNKEIFINSEDVVVGDIVIIEEGDKIPADGEILELEGLGVNESLLTGEVNTVHKTTKIDQNNHFKTNMCYKGTDVVTGHAIIKITSVGKNTEYGKIGTSLNEINKERSSLQVQVDKVVKVYAIVSLILFLSVMFITFINNENLDISKRIIESLISSITVAIATIPEEIPVILTIFLAMGAWHLSHQNTLTRNIKSVENLGKVTVLCTDKTGTLTENKMRVKDTFIINSEFYEASYFSCHLNSYDPMEQAIQKYIKDEKNIINNYKIIHEYIFNNEDKMMGIVTDNKSLYVKGAYETVSKLCNIDDKLKEQIENKISLYSNKGLRVLAIASKNNVDIKEKLTDYKLNIVGLIALEDPIREGINESINKCYSAGIRTILITGDNGNTAMGIAKNIGIKNYDNVITGEELENMSDKELERRVNSTNIFARVYPNHKMRIVTALQNNGEVVAMTGDGINDATALKKADIGISMGKGTNVAKEASDIILLDDNFNTIVSAIENGRTIYNNIKKAISYVLAIHIPIALLSLIIPFLKLPTLLLPIHIVLLELLIDPTSSIIFERVKPDKNIMRKPPRKASDNIIDLSTLVRCILQGLLIFILVFCTYYYYIKNKEYILGSTVSYSVLVLSIMLVANTMKSKKLTIINFFNGFKDKVILIINSLILIILLCLIYIPFLQKSANMCSIGIKEWIIILVLTLIGTIPFDLIKKYT